MQECCYNKSWSIECDKCPRAKSSFFRRRNCDFQISRSRNLFDSWSEKRSQQTARERKVKINWIFSLVRYCDNKFSAPQSFGVRCCPRYWINDFSTAMASIPSPTSSPSIAINAPSTDPEPLLSPTGVSIHCVESMFPEETDGFQTSEIGSQVRYSTASENHTNIWTFWIGSSLFAILWPIIRKTRTL